MLKGLPDGFPRPDFSSTSEVVALGVEERNGVLELLDTVVVELVCVVGEGLELLDDVLQGVELLVGQSELLGLVALHDDVGTGDSSGLGPEVDVVTVLSDGLTDHVGVVVGKDVGLGSSVPVSVHVHVTEGLLLSQLGGGVHQSALVSEGSEPALDGGSTELGVVLDGLVGPQIAALGDQVTLEIAVSALAVLTLLGGGLSGDGLHDGSLVSAVLVRSRGAALPSNESPGSGDGPGDSGEGPLNIVVEVSASHEHGGVGSGAVGVSSSYDLVLLGDVDELGPDVLHVDGTEEILAVVVGEYTECDGGDPAVILEQSEQGYQVLESFAYVRTPVYVSDTMTDGWHDLIFPAYGGEEGTGFRVFHYQDGIGYQNENMEFMEDMDENFCGKKMIADNFIDDMDKGNYLTLRETPLSGN